MENRLALVSTEVERKDQLIKLKINENDELKTKLRKLELSAYELKENENRIQVLNQEIQRLEKEN